jgi:hypothetical protein
VRVAELAAKRPVKRQRQCWRGVKKFLEIGPVDGDDIGCARGAHRGRPRRISQQRELTQRVPAAEHADHGAGGLIDDLEPASTRTPDIAEVTGRSERF